MPGLIRRFHGVSVAAQMLILQVAAIVAVALVAVGFVTFDAHNNAHEAARQRAVDVARTVANSPIVRSSVQSPDPSAVLQPYAERVRIDTGTDFVVIMGLDRTRFTHPDPANIGKKFIGDLGGAPQGQVFTQDHNGTLGRSVRAVVPVLGDNGQVIALVSVGLELNRLDAQVRHDMIGILGIAGLLTIAALGFSGLVSRRMRRMTHGMGEQQLAQMYEYYSAVLHAVREGLILLGRGGRIRMVNDEAVRLLDLPDDAVGRHLSELGLAPGLVDAALGTSETSDEIYLAGSRMVVVSSAPAEWDGRDVGAVVTLRDHTELRSVTGELDNTRRLTESLRSQNHEAANRLHTIVSLMEMGRSEEAIAFATEELEVAQLLTDRLVGAVDDPVVAALLLGKTADAAERGVELTITGQVPEGIGIPARDLVTVIGNLVDNAFDALVDSETKRVEIRLDGSPDELRVRVSDSGPGVDDGSAQHVLERGWSTKAAPGAGRGLGLALVVQAARRHRGEVSVGRSNLGGAEFVVTLRPRVAVPAGMSATALGPKDEEGYP